MNLRQLVEADADARRILHDPAISHVDAASSLEVSDSAVRRYRKNNGIQLKSKVPEAVSTETIESDDLDYLRKELIRVGKLYEKEKTAKSAYVNAVYQAVRDGIDSHIDEDDDSDEIIAFGGFEEFPRGDKSEEVALALVSDLQLAKVTKADGENSYDSVIAARRMSEYADKIIELTMIQKADHEVKKCVVAFLGDMIEGEEIFPGQMWLIDSGLYRQITVTGPEIILSFLSKLASYFEKVEVYWVNGNHGRIGGISSRNHDPETNGDRMLGQIIRLVTRNWEEDGRFTFNMKDGVGESNWYDILTIGNYSALLIHGNQITGGNGLPFNGISRKVNAWAAGGIPEEFKDVLMGHYHTRAVVPVNKRNVYVNGSLESDNDYAREVLAASSDPGQWLLFVHPERGRVTATYGVDLSY